MTLSDLKRWAGQSRRLREARGSAIQMRARMTAPGPGPRLFINSVPKAGTHLVMQALESMPGIRSSGVHLQRQRIVLDDSDLADRNPNVDWDQVRRLLTTGAKPGQYVTAHTWAQPELLQILDALGYAPIFVVRDPRDVVVSLTDYVNRLRRHPHHHRFTQRLSTDKERYLAVINGFPAEGEDPGSVSLAERLRGHEPWLTAPAVLTCRFETLIGPRGGGTEQGQRAELANLAGHAGVAVSRSELDDLAGRVFSTGSATFSKGVIGQWRTRFDDEVRAKFDAAIGPRLLAVYGYEP
ncbi:MAG TPA: hypothetical protein VHZ54_13830 [Solirubrobacterales bacterium]|jgi:hypothetical protein|nr:hypothetical protein [Solirubrobacterales bacterium]